MKRLIIASCVVWMISSVATAATLQSLNQSQVNRYLKGKTITTIPLVTLDGSMVNNTFTGFFNIDGTLEGRMASKPDNGPETDIGKWTTKPNGTLCATWDHWNASKPICVSIYSVNNGLLFINEKNRKLETVVLDNNIQDGRQLS